MATITDRINKVRNYFFPTPENALAQYGSDWRNEKAAEKNLRSYITPVQLQRLRHDVNMWRECIIEAEHAWYPQRVKMQRMYIDTILSGHTLACVNRRKDLTLLRDWRFVDKDGNENEELKKLFNDQWFRLFLNYSLDALFFGYTLVSLGDIEDNKFKNITPIRRFNISPDRLNVTSYVYSLSGAQFLEEPYVDWHVWIPTPTEIGISRVGYGLLYNVALYEIICRNILGQNATSAELYGMPTRVGKSPKTEEHERSSFEAALANMGSEGYILLDAMDELTLVESKGAGQGFKIYSDLEARCEKKISKIILGHADALDSVSGKLGASQGEQSPAVMAMMDKQQSDGYFIETVVNDILIPKLANLGFPVDANYRFEYSNNEDALETQRREDESIQRVTSYVKELKDAGIMVDPQWVQERTGIEIITADNNTDQIAQANLRGSVGGVTAIIQLQQSVAMGYTAREAAINTLVYVYGFTLEEASAMIADTKVIKPTPPVFSNRVKNKLNELYNNKG